MALVYPVYLDAPLMTAFLASLEGGVIEEVTRESKTADTTENTRAAALHAQVSNLLSNFFDVGAKGELSKRVAESLESQYKSTVRFPHAALFIRLRDLMRGEAGLVKTINSAEELARATIGDIVEFRGFAIPSPTFQIRHAFEQMLPVLEPVYNLQETQIEQALVKLDNTKVGEIFELGDEKTPIENKDKIRSIRNTLQLAQKLKRNELVRYQSIGKALQGLFPENSVDVLLLRATGFHGICRVYPVFARNERVSEIYDAQWRCIGKVIGMIGKDEKYDLLKGSPMSYLAKSQFQALASTLKNDAINIEVTEPVVSGPAVILATLAVFA